jgi:ribosomal-protein-alanine N-acetyltransferase
VWTENNRIVAYLFGHLIVDEYHLHNIAVSEEFRKKGIALKLIEKMLNFTNENKVKAVFLEVSSSNLSACNLYEKKGFVAQGTRKKYYPNGDDALLYTFELS